MVRWYAALALVGLPLASLVAAGPRVPRDPKDRLSDIVPGAYIVEFEDGHDDESSFYSDMERKGLPAEKRMTLKYSLFKGSSFQLNETLEVDPDQTALRIANVPAVKKVWPVRLVPVPKNQATTIPSGVRNATIKVGNNKSRAPSSSIKGLTDEIYSPHVMTQVDKLHAEGYTGKGIKIGIIDTGVDYNNPALGGCFGPGCPISFGYDIAGDNYNGYNLPEPDADPMDCLGHGTHVAGIIAARKELNDLDFSGAAPGAEVGMYKVFGCADNSGTDVLIAAFNRAYEDGCDVITASIGGTSGWSEEPWSVAVSRIVDAGVPCTVAAGNAGSEGLFYSSSAADGKGVSAIGSVENTEYPLILWEGRAAIGSGCGNKTKFGYMDGIPTMVNITLPLWALGPEHTVDGSREACKPLKDTVPNLKGKIVLAEFHWCDPGYQALQFNGTGAEYIIWYYFESGMIYRTEVWDEDGQIKGIAMVTLEQAQEWLQLLDNGIPVLAKITEPERSSLHPAGIPNPERGGVPNTFTSWGPTFEVDFKPQFSSVGGDILSTYPAELGTEYAVMSGTSMATPLAAGIYALVMEARGTKDPQILASVFSSTAQAKPWLDFEQIHYGSLAPVPQQGAGLMQAHAAAHATTLLSIPSISFNDTDHLVESVTFSVKNTGKTEVTFDVGHAPALTMYFLDDKAESPSAFPNTIAPGSGASAQLSFSKNKITIPAGSSADITVKPTPPSSSSIDAERLPVYSGFITFNSTTTTETLTLPYMGVAGSMHSAARVLNPEFTFTWRWSDLFLGPVPANETFELLRPKAPSFPPGMQIWPQPNYPAALIDLDFGTALLRCDVLVMDQGSNVTTTEVLGRRVAGSVGGFPIEYQPRTLFATPFLGMTQEGQILPEGSYAFLVRALKIFGDREKEEDYDTIETVSFNIKYVESQG